MRLTRKVAAGIVLVAATMICQPVLSQRQTPPQSPYTLDQAVALVKDRTGGRVLRAETVILDERTIHKVRIITPEGRVRTIDVDAQTGIGK
jgi:uncharacterized membrane protein YkoI